MPGPANALNISQSGYVVFDGVSSFSGRTLQAGTGISITNGDGISGNTTISSTASLTDLHTARFIVASSTSGTGANYTTISSAIAAAVSTAINSTIFLQPGTYTENFTLPANINICAYTADALTPNVTIVGNITCTDAGSRSISGVRLQTNSAALLTVSGSAATVVNLDNCYLNCTNATGISFSSSSSSATINISNCKGDLGTTGIGLFSHSSSGSLNFEKSKFTNSGGSTTASTCSAGALNGNLSQILSPITISGTGAGTWEHSILATTPQNVTALTLGGSGVQIFRWNRISSGTASAVSISTTATLEYNTISSSNTNAVTGAGTINLSSNSFSSTSSAINTTTVSSIPTIGSWTKIQTQTASASSSITFTTGINATFNNYVLVISNMVNSAGGTFQVQLSTNGGSSYIATGYLSGYNQFSYNSTTLANTNSTSSLLIGALGSASGFFNCVCYLYNLTSNTNYPSHNFNSNVTPSVLTNNITFWGAGVYTTTALVNAIQIIPSAGNITSGTFTLYGILQ